MGQYNKIGVGRSHEGQLLRLTLDAPKANILDMEMALELSRAVQEAGQDPSLKAIAIASTGSHFSFGASVAEHQKEVVGEMLRGFHKLFAELISTSLPTAAVVRGYCLGGGMELASFCHWIFCNPEAVFGQPEIKLGVIAPVASLVLPYRIGQSAADDLLLSGRNLEAAEAKRMGLVHTISDAPGEAMEQFLEEHILSKSSAALKFAVRSARYQMHQGLLRQTAELEEMYTQELMETRDANEGIAAFMEKREPVWQNR